MGRDPFMRNISTFLAPAAVGPYSQAVCHGEYLFVSGQLGIDPAKGELVADDALLQMKQCLSNISAIAEAAGTGISKTIKTTIMVTDLSDFAKLNDVYATYFSSPFPARATFEVSALPKGALVAVDAIVALD